MVLLLCIPLKKCGIAWTQIGTFKFFSYLFCVYTKGNASSLLSELEQSGIDQSEIFNFGASLNDSGQQNTCSSPDEDHNKVLSAPCCINCKLPRTIPVVALR